LSLVDDDGGIVLCFGSLLLYLLMASAE